MQTLGLLGAPVTGSQCRDDYPGFGDPRGHFEDPALRAYRFAAGDRQRPGVCHSAFKIGFQRLCAGQTAALRISRR